MANILFAIHFGQHIGIGTQSFDDSEVLKIVSNNKGVLIPNVSITSLSSSSPIVNPAKSLIIYNTNPETGKGFFIWKNASWNPLIDTTNIYKFLGIVRSESVQSTGGVDDGNLNGAVSYTIGEAPSAHNWQLIPGLTKSITINSPSNSVSVAAGGIAQINSTGSSNSFLTYGIGIFIDKKLTGVRNFTISGKGSCLFNDFNIYHIAQNLSIGDHLIEIYETERVNFGTQTEYLRFGNKISTCNNISSGMDKSILNVQISEK